MRSAQTFIACSAPLLFLASTDSTSTTKTKTPRLLSDHRHDPPRPLVQALLLPARLCRRQRLQRAQDPRLGRARRGPRHHQADEHRLFPKPRARGHDGGPAARPLRQGGREAGDPGPPRPPPPGRGARHHRALARRRGWVGRGQSDLLPQDALREVQSKRPRRGRPLGRVLERLRGRPQQRAARQGLVGHRVPAHGLEARRGEARGRGALRRPDAARLLRGHERQRRADAVLGAVLLGRGPVLGGGGAREASREEEAGAVAARVRPAGIYAGKREDEGGDERKKKKGRGRGGQGGGGDSAHFSNSSRVSFC